MAEGGNNHTLGFDQEQLSKYLETHPEMEGFTEQSNSFKTEAEDALASQANLEELYTKDSWIEGHPYLGLDTKSISNINTLVEKLENGYSGLPENGATTEAIGGEVTDEAASSGVAIASDAALGPLLGLIPFAGYITYQDITTGSNFVTQAIFSGKEDAEKVEEQGGEGAEAMHWQKMPSLNCNNPQGYSWCFDKRVAEYFENSTSGTSGENWLYNHDERQGMYETTHTEVEGFYQPAYYLQGKVGGWFYMGANGFYGKNPVMEGWPWEEDESGGCFDHGISGWPNHMIHVATTVLVAKGAGSCNGGSPEKVIQEFTGTLIIRTPSRMHIGLPKQATKSTVEKLQEEGKIAKQDEGEGHLPTSPSQENEDIKKAAQKKGEGGQRRKEKFECHLIGCELEYEAPTTETPTEPASPGKQEETPPPIPGIVEIPDCSISPTTGEECRAKLEEYGFTKVNIDIETWEHANVKIPAGDVIATDPGAGSVVETTNTVTVDDNPDSEKMPVEIPKINKGSETGTEYKERLEREGWTKVEVKTLPETNYDPEVGPDQAAYTDPAEGTQEDPARTTKVEVSQNPSDAPVPIEGPSKLGPPTEPGFNMPSFGVACKGFPFGVPCWLIHTVEGWSATPVAPEWGLSKFTVEGREVPATHFHLSVLEPIMEKVRVAQLIFITIGLVLLFYRFAKGGSPPSGAGTPDVGGGGEIPTPDEGVYL
jgi:hypothetical protein